MIQNGIPLKRITFIFIYFYYVTILFKVDMRVNYKQIVYYLLLIGIILFSFFLYSSRYYPLLNSDDALNILMAYDYDFPNHLYCWGQDRGGTLIPLISQLFIKWFCCSPVVAVSLSNYLILLLGYWGFTSILKSKYCKIVFTLVWFLPFQRFIDVLRFPIGVEYSLIGFSILLITQLDHKTLKKPLKHLLLLSIMLIWVVSVWVSDLALVSISILLFILLIYHCIKNKNRIIDKTKIFYLVLGVLLCYFFIRYAKSSASGGKDNYVSINSFSDIENGLQILKKAFSDVFTFHTGEYIVSLYAYLALLIIPIFIYVVIKKKLFIRLLSNKWFSFFLLDTLGILCVFLVSSWVLANEMGRWYFVATYISIAMTILIAIDHMEKERSRNIVKILILALCIIGSISTPITLRYVSPKTWRPTVERVGEIKQLGEIGLIAGYWHAYKISCSAPELITATPHDACEIKNKDLVDSVFNKKNIYIARDMWMDSFPDTLFQFGYALLREGDSFTLGEHILCKYHKIRFSRTFSLQELNHNSEHEIKDSIPSAYTLLISKDCTECKDKYVLYGPYSFLGIGKYTAYFYVKATRFENLNTIARLDVASDWGTKIHVEQNISKKDFISDSNICVKLRFETKKRYDYLEFRIYYYGNADLYFDRVVLVEAL